MLAQSRPRSLNSQAPLIRFLVTCVGGRRKELLLRDASGARYRAVANVDLATLIQKLGDLLKIFMSVIGMKRQGKPLHAAESKAINRGHSVILTVINGGLRPSPNVV